MYIHSSLIRKHIEYLVSQGISTDNLFRLTGLSEAELKNDGLRFEISLYLQVLSFALEHTGDSFYGLKLGREPHVAGTLGIMCASCRNLREAFIQGCRYFRMQGDFAKTEYLENKGKPRIRYTLQSHELLDLPDLARQDIELMFSFLNTILRVNSNNKALPQGISFQFPEPRDTGPYLDAFGILPVFSSGHNEMAFSKSDLMFPMKAYNQEIFDLLRNHLESQLKESATGSRVSDRVRSILLSSMKYTFPDITTVASKLNVSARTLQRKLAVEKTSYQELVKKARLQLAGRLLRQKELTISEISYILGYSDPGNFSRSFKKQTGQSPMEFRTGRLLSEGSV